MNENVRTRAAMLASFYAWLREGQRNGRMVTPNAAVLAGMALHFAHDVRAAETGCRALPPLGDVTALANAVRYLGDLASDEQADTQPPAALEAAR